MAITLVASALPANMGTTPGATSSSVVEGGADFANLLSSQIFGGVEAVTADLLALEQGEDSGSDVPSGQEAAGLFAGLFAFAVDTGPEASLPHLVARDGLARTSGAPVAKVDAALPSGSALSSVLPGLSDAETALADASVRDLAAPVAGKGQMAANIAGLASPLTTESTREDFEASLTAQTAQTAQTAVASRHPAEQTELAVRTPVHDGRWADSFGERIVWLAKNDQQSAQLSLNPPQLGPLQISLKMNGDQASAVFASPHAEVRQAIEEAMPRLREVLAGAGIDLGQTSVGAQMAQQQHGNAYTPGDSPRFSGDGAILREVGGRQGEMPPAVQRSGRGLVDLFA